MALTRPAATKLNPPSLPELAYDHLRDAILDGKLEAGSPLRQEEIAARLGISRLPIREALRRLDSEGLAVLRPRRGYVVASLNRDEIDDVLDLQATLEARAGYAATLRRSDAVTRELETCLAQLDRITARSPVNVSAFAELNLKFHDTLLESSGRPFLCRMLRLLRSNAERYSRMAAGMLVDLRASQKEHRSILDAYRAGNASKVAELCRSHRDATRIRLLAHLDKSSLESHPAKGA
jgi:DNA-binding GntR family transcriptional regulator